MQLREKHIKIDRLISIPVFLVKSVSSKTNTLITVLRFFGIGAITPSILASAKNQSS